MSPQGVGAVDVRVDRLELVLTGLDPLGQRARVQGLSLVDQIQAGIYDAPYL